MTKKEMEDRIYKLEHDAEVAEQEIKAANERADHNYQMVQTRNARIAELEKERADLLDATSSASVVKLIKETQKEVDK